MVFGENLWDHEMYDNCLFLTLFLIPPKTKREEEKENEVAKPALKHFFQDPMDFHLIFKFESMSG